MSSGMNSRPRSTRIVSGYLFGKTVSLDALRVEKMKNSANLADENLQATLRTLVEARLNVLISGSTSTGKTNFACHLLTHVNKHERLITIVDAFELFPNQPNTVNLLADRDSGSQRSDNVLLQASLPFLARAGVAYRHGELQFSPSCSFCSE
jgi:type IV secretion system protein VirB11